MKGETILDNNPKLWYADTPRRARMTKSTGWLVAAMKHDLAEYINWIDAEDFDYTGPIDHDRLAEQHRHFLEIIDRDIKRGFVDVTGRWGVVLCVFGIMELIVFLILDAAGGFGGTLQ